MQYLLSQEEHDRLQHLVALGQASPAKDKLQKFCTRVANEMPITWTWGDGKDKPKPWQCILTIGRDWYCDQCPAREICPLEDKEYSK